MIAAWFTAWSAKARSAAAAACASAKARASLSDSGTMGSPAKVSGVSDGFEGSCAVAPSSPIATSSADRSTGAGAIATWSVGDRT